MTPSGILDLQQKGDGEEKRKRREGMFPWRLMKADWMRERSGARGARRGLGPSGESQKDLESREDHGPANPPYPLKRTHIVWPAL